MAGVDGFRRHEPSATVVIAAVHNARIEGWPGPVDLSIDDGVVAAVGAAIPGRPAGPVLELGGATVLAGFVEPHVHLDKAFLMARLSAAGVRHRTLPEAMAATAALRPTFTRSDIRARAERVLGELSDNGVCAARVHVEVEPTLGLLGVETHLELRDEWAPLLRLQLVAFPQNGFEAAPETLELVDEAMRMGCDVVGGCPYADDDQARHVDQVFALAEKWDAPADFHLDFSDDPAQRTVDLVVQRTLADGLAGRVAVGHLTSLAAMCTEDAARRADGLAAAGIHVIALPATDLFLGGRGSATERPGSLTPIALLAARGVNVSLGTNNIQNAFTPLGRSAPLTMAWLAGIACHLGDVASNRWLLDTVTANPARVVGFPSWDLTAGAPADMAILDTDDPADVIPSGPTVLGTVHAGRYRPSSGPRFAPSVRGAAR